MPLAPSTRLGPYEIVAMLGAGGMGEVYRARDPRMGREVAIKVSAERFSDRFEREVHAVAALNHPNICHVYDVGPNYLVMELLEGPTLAERIASGAIPLEEALAIGRQIAEALEAAHEKGIVHRDLKPGNIKIKADGVVKVLDFGLAKLAEPVAVGQDEATLTVQQATRAGVILGTAGYMSPEQARGMTVDKRADIWAFGVVLYEMLGGRRLFQGESMTDTLAAVLTKEPAWERVPVKARPLLRRCLEKDPKLAVARYRRPLTQGKVQFPTSFTPDGTRLVFSEVTSGTGAEIRTVPVESGSGQMRAGEPQLFLKTSNINNFSAFSPDGRWLAYADAEAGSYEVFVRAFPDKGAKVQISNAGGTMPVWSRNGHELFYRTEDQRIMVANYTVKGESFISDKPRVWFGKQLANFGLAVNYDLAPDGKRFVVLMPAEGPEPRETQSHVTLVVNFFDEVRRRVAAQGK